MGRNNSNAQNPATPAVTPDPNEGTQNPATPAVTPAPTTATSSPSGKKKVKMVKIKLELTREHKDDVFVSVNDKKYQIKRGVEVEVPWFVAEILRNQEKALMTLFENQTKAQQNVL